MSINIASSRSQQHFAGMPSFESSHSAAEKTQEETSQGILLLRRKDAFPQPGRMATRFRMQRTPPTIRQAPHGKITRQRPEHGCMCEPAPHVRWLRSAAVMMRVKQIVGFMCYFSFSALEIILCPCKHLSSSLVAICCEGPTKACEP